MEHVWLLALPLTITTSFYITCFIFISISLIGEVIKYDSSQGKQTQSTD